ncbi:MAG: MOSC N-terminal beta barrel domain-containing protein, partial [Geminicoccaceae bacterium]|nr:MOSC N-terminal beta barrel domain-containing protein [Geminicoccaceae bacterium]
MTDLSRVAAIFRYPVKGMSAEALAEVELQPFEALPLDRRFAVALADSPFDPADPVWLRKTHFLMLMRDEQLAALDVRYADALRRIEIRRGGRTLLEADLETVEGVDELESFFQTELDL